MIKKKEIIIVVAAFLLGLGGMYLYSRSEIATNKTFTRRIIDNTISALRANDKISHAYESAYSEVILCFSNLNVCNLEESKKKLDTFNNQKEQGEKEIQNTTKDMDQIISDIKNDRN